MKQNRKTFTPTKINISELTDEAVRSVLEMKFTDFAIQKQLAVETQRVAATAQLKAKSQEAAAQIAMLEFITASAEHFPEVQIEPFWFAYKSNGDTILESPYTERDMRNGMRLQRQQMEQAANSLDESGGKNNGDLYEQDEE